MKCEEFEEAMHGALVRHVRNLPEESIPDVTEDLTGIITVHLCRKVEDTPDRIGLNGIDKMALCMQIANLDMDYRMIPES